MSISKFLQSRPWKSVGNGKLRPISHDAKKPLIKSNQVEKTGRLVPVVTSCDNEDLSESNNVYGKKKLTETDHVLLKLEAISFLGT